MPRVRGANACDTCRGRKLKCDEQSPICGQCIRAKRYCDKTVRTRSKRCGRPHDHSYGDDDPRTALQDPEIAELFHHYNAIAAWYDLSDGQASFQKLVPLKALDDSLLFNAVIAFAAIHRSRTRAPTVVTIATRFHEKCVKRLIALDTEELNHNHENTLAAVCLLRSYELLAEDNDPNRHLTGAYAFAGSRSFAMSEASLFKAGFFNFLREDITFSLTNRCPLKLDLAAIGIPATPLDDEDQLNIASLYLGAAINEVFGMKDQNAAVRNFSEKWRMTLPAQFQPYYVEEVIATAPTFPIIRMLRCCHVSTLQYALTAEAVWGSRLPHNDAIELNAIHICGLAFTSDSAAVMVNSYGPISFCCQYLTHTPLRMDLIRRLHASRESTGWPVDRMIDQLGRTWQLDTV